MFRVIQHVEFQVHSRQPLIVWMLACFSCCGCQRHEQSPEIQDSTCWNLTTSLENIKRIDVSTQFASNFPSAIVSYSKDMIAATLIDRGFTIDESANYRLLIEFDGPWTGKRGIPVSSRYAMVRTRLSISDKHSGNVIIDAIVDGLVEEGDVSFIDHGEGQRIRGAVSSVTGKVGRTLNRLAFPASLPALVDLPQFPRIAPENRPTLAVIDFAATSNVPSDVGVSIANQLRTILNDAGVFILLDREHIKTLLGEQDFAAVVSCDKAKCLVEYGKVLHAQKVMNGTVSRLGSDYAIYVAITDVNTSRVEANDQVAVSDNSVDFLSAANMLARRAVTKMEWGSLEVKSYQK